MGDQGVNPSWPPHSLGNFGKVYSLSVPQIAPRKLNYDSDTQPILACCKLTSFPCDGEDEAGALGVVGDGVPGEVVGGLSADTAVGFCPPCGTLLSMVL